MGSYHELGSFVSGVAALPRIVTLHDLSLKPVSLGRGRAQASTGDLIMDVTARTYRYIEEEVGTQ